MCGTISAWRGTRDCGKGEKYTRKEKEDRNAKLKAQLLKKGYGVTAIIGIYTENYGTEDAISYKEDSFIVVDLKDTKNLKKDLIKLGTQYEQDSITYSKPNGEYYLISTNKCPNGYPGRGKIGVEIKLGKPFFGKDGEFHSKVNGRPFIFKECIQSDVIKLKDLSISEIRSVVALSEKANETI